MKKVFNGSTLFTAKGFKHQLLALAICVSAGTAFIDEAQAASPNVNPPSLKASAPNVYVVKKGDTLWDIAGKFLSKPWRWPEIWASNRHVKNPHWIYPGDRLLLCTLDGRPLIGKDEGDGCDGVIRRHLGGASLQPQVRVESINNAIPVIPLQHIQQWLDHSLILSTDSINNVPYVLGTADKRVIAAAGQTIYARGNGLNVGQRYGIYRIGEPYTTIDGNGKKTVIALEVKEVASAVNVATENDISTLELTKSYGGEVRKSDIVLPAYESNLPTLFYPTATNEITEGGQIIRVLDSIGTAAQHSVVTINRGAMHGAKVGHVLSVSLEGETVKDPKLNQMVKLPNQRVGNIMIFKTFDQLSYAYVLETSLPIKTGAVISAPPETE